MAFISEHLLLDLPLHKLKEGQWQDESGHEHHAKTNAFCTEDSLPKLGSCLHLHNGGQLQLSSPVTGTENRLTVEFWALPDVANETPPRQILAGPVEVWMDAGTIQWSISGSEPKAAALPAPSTEPDHWAITAQRSDADSPFAFSVYRNAVEITTKGADTPPAGIVAPPGTLDEQLSIGGAEHIGWIGSLAHLRIWGATLTSQDLKNNLLRDVTAHAAFKASTSIDWTLLNADDEPSLYIQSTRKQTLRLVVKNVTSGVTLNISPESQPAQVSPSNHHLRLVFRPGTLRQEFLADQAQLDRVGIENPGWCVSKAQENGQDCLYFLWVGEANKSLGPGAELILKLPDIAVNPGSGSRTTRVLLQYNGINLTGAPEATTLDGHRTQLLNIIYREPLAAYRRPPLEVGVVGAPAILNNGTETCLSLYIKNLNRNEDGAAAPILLGPAVADADKQPKFILEIDIQDPLDIAAGGLGDEDDLNNTLVRTISDTKIQADQVNIDKLGASGGTFRWRITPTQTQTTSAEKVGFKENATVFLTLVGLKTTAPPGRSVLRLRYEDFDDYGEGVFEIPVERLPAIPVKLTQGGAGYGLAVGHDPRSGHTDTDPDPMVLNEVLSVRKQKGSGDAVRIENAGGGSGMTVVQSGSGPTAQFSGGSGVAIDGNLQVNGNLRIGDQTLDNYFYDRYVVTSGYVVTGNRGSNEGWTGYWDLRYNNAQIYPPSGFTMTHLMGFVASIALIHFAGEVDSNDSLWCRWRKEKDFVRVWCNNSENRDNSAINYLAIWRK